MASCLGHLRGELLHQSKLLGLVGLLADLLEQLAFRRLGVNRAQVMALRERGAGENHCKNQGAEFFSGLHLRNSDDLLKSL